MRRVTTVFWRRKSLVFKNSKACVVLELTDTVSKSTIWDADISLSRSVDQPRLYMKSGWSEYVTTPICISKLKPNRYSIMCRISDLLDRNPLIVCFLFTSNKITMSVCKWNEQPKSTNQDVYTKCVKQCIIHFSPNAPIFVLTDIIC